jgi:hypothetical protein
MEPHQHLKRNILFVALSAYLVNGVAVELHSPFQPRSHRLARTRLV